MLSQSVLTLETAHTLGFVIKEFFLIATLRMMLILDKLPISFTEHSIRLLASAILIASTPFYLGKATSYGTANCPKSFLWAFTVAHIDISYLNFINYSSSICNHCPLDVKITSSPRLFLLFSVSIINIALPCPFNPRSYGFAWRYYSFQVVRKQ